MKKITVEGQIGEHISDTAKRAILLAQDGAEVDFSFNKIPLIVTATSTVGDVCAEYNRVCEERSKAYRASPEYALRQREAEAREQERNAKLLGALALAPSRMTLRDAAIWQSWVDANKDGYGGACVSYAERWARVMEGMMSQGATVAGCAKEASHLADFEGITGFMYGAAVSMLSQAWQHGEDLRRWHNIDTQIGTEGEKANESGGVLNPALLNIG